jgi:hypothetical protein
VVRCIDARRAPEAQLARLVQDDTLPGEAQGDASARGIAS